MKSYTRKLASLILAVSMLVSMSVTAYAAEDKLAKYSDLIGLKAGSAQVYAEGQVKDLDAPVFTETVSKKNGVTDDEATPGFYATVTENDTVYYAPLSLFEAVYGATVTYYNKGHQAVVSFPDGMTVAVGAPDEGVTIGSTPKSAYDEILYSGDDKMIFVDNKLERLEDSVRFANNTIYVPVETFFEVAFGKYTAQDGITGTVCCSGTLITDMDSVGAELAGKLTAAKEGMQAPTPTLVTENVPVLPATITSAGTYMTSTAEQDLFGDGKEHEWNLYIPKTYDPAAAEEVPLLIILHGNSSRSWKYAPRSFYRYLAELHNIILVWPTSTDAGIDNAEWNKAGKPWNEVFRIADDVNPDVIFLNGMIDYMLENYSIDAAKVFMSGFSNGDLMTNRFASSKYGNRLAGFMSAGGAVHYSSAWTGNPLEGAEEGRPVHNVPAYQTRGGNDLSALTVNEFGDRNPHIIDPVAEGQKMASSNEYAKNVWLEKNEAATIPEISVRGINNYEIYRSGEKGDVLYHSIHGESHAEVANAPQIVYDQLITRYSRNADGTLTDNGASIKGDKGAVALVVGASRAFVDNTVTDLAQEVIREDGLIYAPVDALVKGFGASVSGETITVSGKRVAVTAGSADITVDGKAVTLAGKVLKENNVLYVPAASFAELVLGLYSTEKADAIYICDHAGVLTYSTYYTLYRILDPEDFAAFTAMSNIMGIPTNAVVGQEVDLTAHAVVYPIGATKGIGDVKWSIYEGPRGITNAAATLTEDGKLIATEAGTVRVTAMVEGGTGVGEARFLQNFDVVISEAPSFADVAEKDWFKGAVDYVSANGIMNGVGGEVFGHDRMTTRATIWTMLARLSGKDTTGGTTWFEKGREWAMESGISDGTDPNGEITREQLAVMLYRYAGSPDAGYDISGYSDHKDVSDWALEGQKWAVGNGIVSGKGDGTLSPQSLATRAEVAQMFMNFMKKIER